SNRCYEYPPCSALRWVRPSSRCLGGHPHCENTVSCRRAKSDNIRPKESCLDCPSFCRRQNSGTRHHLCRGANVGKPAVSGACFCLLVWAASAAARCRAESRARGNPDEL